MQTIGDMTVLFLLVFRFVRLLLSGHHAVAVENAVLRMQIAAFQRKRKRPLLTTLDRVFWIALHSLWCDWRNPLIYVQADTVIRGSASGSGDSGLGCPSPQRQRRGRPDTAAELRRLIEQMATANPLWRAPRIHGELKMLGIAISEAHRVAHPAQAPSAASPNMEDFPAQPCRPNGIHRFLYRADDHNEGAVRIYRPGTPPTQGVAF